MELDTNTEKRLINEILRSRGGYFYELQNEFIKPILGKKELTLNNVLYITEAIALSTILESRAHKIKKYDDNVRFALNVKDGDCIIKYKFRKLNYDLTISFNSQRYEDIFIGEDEPRQCRTSYINFHEDFPYNFPHNPRIRVKKFLNKHGFYEKDNHFHDPYMCEFAPEVSLEDMATKIMGAIYALYKNDLK